MSEDEQWPLEFESASHAYDAGLLAGLLARIPGLTVSPAVDEKGNYINRIHVAMGDSEYTFTVAVLPEELSE